MKSMMPAWPLQVAITSTGAAAVVNGQWGRGNGGSGGSRRGNGGGGRLGVWFLL